MEPNREGLGFLHYLEWRDPRSSETCLGDIIFFPFLERIVIQNNGSNIMLKKINK